MDNNGSQQERGRTPPYVSFRSFSTLLDDFKTSGVPPRIDRSVLKRFSGGLGSQLLVALRSLGLMDEGGVPSDDLQILVDHYGTDDFPASLRHVLQASYPFLQAIDLTTATPSMFAEAFQNATSAKEDVLRKCRTFYLHAAKVAGIDIGKRLEAGTYTRTPSGNGRRRKKTVMTDDTPSPAPVSPAHVSAAQKELEYQLIDLMTEPDIDDNVKQSIWALVQYLTARKAKKAAASTDATAS